MKTWQFSFLLVIRNLFHLLSSAALYRPCLSSSSNCPKGNSSKIGYSCSSRHIEKLPPNGWHFISPNRLIHCRWIGPKDSVCLFILFLLSRQTHAGRWKSAARETSRFVQKIEQSVHVAVSRSSWNSWDVLKTAHFRENLTRGQWRRNYFSLCLISLETWLLTASGDLGLRGVCNVSPNPDK